LANSPEVRPQGVRPKPTGTTPIPPKWGTGAFNNGAERARHLGKFFTTPPVTRAFLHTEEKARQY